jgi:hypothetical protein
MLLRKYAALVALSAALFSVSSVTQAQNAPKPPSGFKALFDGKSLDGWQLIGGHGRGYIVENGILTCPKDGGGNLFTTTEYSDFVLKLEFRTEAGGNNGVGLRAPREGDAAYQGMECQVLDDYDAQYANLEPGQYCGSIYKVAAAKRGALKKAGEWQSYEITCKGRQVKVVLNGQTIVDADLNKVVDPKTIAEHPGMMRDKGFVGFLGHNSFVEFKNIFIKDISKPEKDNVAPAGFKALFNGRDFTGWKGLVKDPPARAKMTPEQLEAEQKAADQQMTDHWKIVDGVLNYDGKGNSLCTVKDYRNFEMLVDWKIGEKGDSGIYLRGSPQIQIWDRVEGSGGLYNNQKNPSNPTKRADKPVGEWNRFRIVMIGDKVTVYLNGELVVHNVTMENYWERDKPIYPTGQLELQHHGDHLYFKNVYVRELPD